MSWLKMRSRCVPLKQPNDSCDRDDAVPVQADTGTSSNLGQRSSPQAAVGSPGGRASLDASPDGKREGDVP